MESIATRPLNMAFLGCGFATRMHSKTLSRLRNQTRLYYASRDAQKARQFNQKYQGAGWFDSYESALASSDIEIIFIATPPHQHLELTIEALRAGKHVIVEKPPFFHSSDFDQVMEIAGECGKNVFVAENYFYKPLAFKLRALLKEGVIGEPLFFHFNALKFQRTGDWRDDPHLAGGGALFEGGIHWINFVANLGFPIETFQGYIPGEGLLPEKSILIAMKASKGPVGSLYYSWEVPSIFKGLRLSKIYGREGTITFESNGVILIVRGKQKKVIFPGFKDISGYKGMFIDFFNAIRSGKEPRFTLEMAKRDLQIIEQIYTTLPKT
ncbi:MAG: gfo/Idh/MocA family oxidoreductase [Calditrichaeota bacterium]|nr:MAG: gfo/Idh/MocA family oxidoreductase [Calditrichota bacterium]